MKTIKKQQGVTMITVALGLVLLSFFVLIAVTVWPVYMENFNVSSHLQRMESDTRVKGMTKEEIRSTLIKRFGIDDVKNVTASDIIINGDPGGGYTIEVSYEVRKEFLGNVDLVIFFEESVEVK